MHAHGREDLRGQRLRTPPGIAVRLLPVGWGVMAAPAGYVFAVTLWDGLFADDGVPALRDRALAVLAAAVCLGGLVLIAGAVVARLVITPEGMLSVRSLPPWRRRVVDIATLVELRRGVTSGREVFGGGQAAGGSTTQIYLRDAADRTVKLRLEDWRDSVQIARLLGAWTPSSAVEPGLHRDLRAWTAGDWRPGRP